MIDCFIDMESEYMIDCLIPPLSAITSGDFGLKSRISAFTSSPF